MSRQILLVLFLLILFSHHVPTMHFVGGCNCNPGESQFCLVMKDAVSLGFIILIVNFVVQNFLLTSRSVACNREVL